MNKPKGYGNSKPWRKYRVYGVTLWGPQFIGETTAKSEDQAVNNVRYRTYGLKLTNDPFYAVEILDPNADLSSYHWYVVEYCVANGNESYFIQSYADYKVKFAKSESDAQRSISNEWDYYSISELATRITFFGRTKQFDTEDDAVICARDWKLENEKYKEELQNE